MNKSRLTLWELAAEDLPFLFELWHNHRIMELARERFEEMAGR